MKCVVAAQIEWFHILLASFIAIARQVIWINPVMHTRRDTRTGWWRTRRGTDGGEGEEEGEDKIKGFDLRKKKEGEKRSPVSLCWPDPSPTFDVLSAELLRDGSRLPIPKIRIPRLCPASHTRDDFNSSLANFSTTILNVRAVVMRPVPNNAGVIRLTNETALGVLIQLNYIQCVVLAAFRFQFQF